MKRRVLTIATALGIAPILALSLAAPASAHGYINSPMSRQGQCAAGWLECGQIKWEPQSVEGPKGLTSCSGGNARFAELDDDSKPWRPTSVGNSVNFRWTFTAPHRSSTFEYFLGGRKLASFDLGGAQPPEGLTHTVNLGGVTGRQKLLAVWNVYDTANAFYACVDLQVG